MSRRGPVLVVLVVLFVGAIAFGAAMDARDTAESTGATLPLPASGPDSTDPDSTDPVLTEPTQTTGPATTAPTSTAPVEEFTPLPPDGKSSAERRLALVQTVRDPQLQPKSVVHSGNGLFFAQNMMYRHNVSVYDRSGTLVSAIDDTVDLAAYDLEPRTVAQGSPVEVSFTSDGAFAYVSNYKMYGSGFNPVADDECGRGNWDESFVYRIDVGRMAIDQVIRVGAVPKYLQVSPDDRWVVVSNWCSYDVSIIDTAAAREVRRIEVGFHPRGIAITRDGSRAYVSVMGEGRIVSIALGSFAVGEVPNAGGSPRHLVLSPDDRTLYVSNNLQGQVRKIDLRTGTVGGIVATGTQPRTMVLADDGASLFVVNYRDDVLSKVRTSDMKVIQEIGTGDRPVGVTYDPATRRVWVANYAGSISVYEDS
jgi:YVTN family beta-propeller protein